MQSLSSLYTSKHTSNRTIEASIYTQASALVFVTVRRVTVNLMNRVADVFVVGGGPAGLAVAIAARQKGLVVVLADGAAPPIDKACGEGMMPETQAALSSLGVRFIPGDGFRFQGIRFCQRGLSISARFPAGQ